MGDNYTMKPILSRFFVFCVAAAALLSLSACGNKGPLVPPKSLTTSTFFIR
jgi:predicted small lipoprotein YifL